MNVSDNKVDSTEYSLLRSIKSPTDLKMLDVTELPALCLEIRKYLINTLSSNPGHFASSMGAVDIIVAMHYVFDTPRDRIVFDVGHQAYSHKILTGRFEKFQNQRKLGGLSGFPFPAESEYDTFVCGHAGNSISAALGMAIADMNTPGEEDRHTVALIGDASISNGIAFEGLNNAAQNPNNLLIILNDNEMSIDDNVGSLHRYLSEIHTSERYNKWRYKVYNKFRKWGLVNDKDRGFVLRFNNALKSLMARQQNIFEGLNIRYFGPFDGHDVVKIVKTLQDIKEMKGPRILHLHTTKGKGYEVAEQNPAPWHAPGKFNPATGVRQSESDKNLNDSSPLLWQEVFGRTLLELASQDKRVVGITAGMLSGTSMKLMEKFPDRLFDVGISEGHAVTFAGGLAAAGKRPFVAIYSSFLQRGYDNIIHDVAIQNLPVTFCIDRAGIVGEDGVTHHGLFDIAYLRVIPGMRIAAPMDAATLRNLMLTSLCDNGPIAIRYPRGKSDAFNCSSDMVKLEIGQGRKLTNNDNAKIAVLSVGPIGEEVKKTLEDAHLGREADHFDMIWVKPLDEKLLEEVAANYEYVITVEDGVKSGGFGTAVEEWLSDHDCHIPIKRLGVSDAWVYQGGVGELRHMCGYDATGIAEAITEASASINNLKKLKR